LAVSSACSGSIQAATRSTETPQLAAAPAPTQRTAPPSTSAPTSTANNGSDGLLARGKLIFEKTAGGVGCAACHGLDGKGGSAPYNRGVSESRFREVLAGSAMNFIKLSDEEIKAVLAYLQWLATQP
jgi:mono/diheme cytochrome c family protein